MSCWTKMYILALSFSLPVGRVQQPLPADSVTGQRLWGKLTMRPCPRKRTAPRKVATGRATALPAVTRQRRSGSGLSQVAEVPMIIFRHSISYGGGTVEPIRVRTTIEVPTLQFAADNGQVSRQFGGDTASASFTQLVNQTRYRATLPEYFLTRATDESTARAAQFFRAALAAADLDALTIPVSVGYRSPDGQVLGEQEFEVLVVPKMAGRE
jgi:hypothetical protein